MKKSIFFAFIIILVGLGGAVGFIKTKPKPKQSEVQQPIVPVEVTQVALSDEVITIEAGGTVMAAREVNISPQVSGRVLEIHPALIPGGFLERGETLLHIDPRDFEFAVEQRKAEVARAEFALKDEMGRRAIAQQEWDLLGDEIETTAEGRELALREPHLAQARANLEAAESALEQAKLNLARTHLEVPFNAQIKRKSVETGQVVGPNSMVATLTGTDEYWVQASVPLDQLAFFQRPDMQGDGGAQARVVTRTATGDMEREGRVIRLLNDLEERGRMARVLISVSDPLGLRGGGQMPLLLSTYVHVAIHGRLMHDVIAIPPAALREGDRVWIMNADDVLEIRNVQVLWRQGEKVLIGQGIDSQERVIVSRIPTPVPGMKLRAIQSERDNTKNDSALQATTGSSVSGGGND
ncbi:Efflux RND transporter periplasmic adaptor subunit [Sulfidibacter corallicola]|uniref:Efflux RND transporter periplasmic adaptor subunit n=1 Tax=Sulfidibacter corallicola TaxID=2818388 RepID=A0A8A4TZN8_SULCO|nr:efflux RND transporter periplasmic adaptor subunit [Sulfidibacter corallicola]QTD51965.1 efflux RND transporter periplasmic adaptor subunit [Sulfidibacter corallicola]